MAIRVKYMGQPDQIIFFQTTGSNVLELSNGKPNQHSSLSKNVTIKIDFDNPVTLHKLFDFH